MKKIRLTESGLKGFVRAIVEQVEGEYYHMEPGQFLTMLTAGVNRMDIVTKLKRFQGKLVWIDGDLDLSSKPITTLGNLAGVSGDLKLASCKNLKDLGKLKYVEGKLDISYSRVSSVDGVEFGSISAYDSELENKKIRQEYNAKFAEMQADREEGTFDDLNSSEEAAKRWALLEYLSNNDSSVMIKTDEVKEEYDELKRRLELLQDRYNETDDDETVDSLQDEIDEVESRIEEIESEYYDVYDIVDYGYNSFIVRDLGGFRNPNEYSVMTTDEADKALDDYWDNYIDDVGYENFSKDTLERHIDGDDVADDFKDYYYDDISSEPQAYFDLNNLDYTDDQEREIATLQAYIDELDVYISELEEKQSSLEDEIPIDSDEYSPAYDEIQNLIERAEEKKDETQEKIDEIEPEVSEDMIESEVEDKLAEIRRDPLGFLQDMGYDSKTIFRYVDEKSLKEELISNGDYGDLNSYDGSYDEINVDGTYYVVMRTN
jgi:hypothetical protein